VESNVDTALETFFKTEVLNIDCEKVRAGGRGGKDG